MRWTLIFVLCLAVASAKYAKKSRFGQMLHNVADFENGIERDLHDNWSDEDSEESEEEMYQEPQEHHYQPHHKKHQKQHQHRIDSQNKHKKWIPEEEDDDEYDSQDNDYTEDRREQKRPQRDQDDPKQPCQPKYQLLDKLDQLNAQLAARLHQASKQMDDDKNTVVSPVAVQLALAAVAQGARGNTQRQISRILDFGMSKNQNKNAYAALTRALKGQGPDQSGSKAAQIKSTTTLILGQQSAQEQFIDAIKTCFDGEVKKCDFRQKPQQCRDQINQWLASKTGLKSQSTLTPTTVTGNTKMISIGTMHLKANWGKQFRKNQKTVQGQFYPLGEQKSSSVKTLQSEGEFNYFEDEQMQIVGIPTQEKQLTIYVILPKDRHGLGQLEKQRIQYGKQLEELLYRCDSKKQPVKIQIPTFQIIHKMDAKQTLRKLGVEDAFDGDLADFSGVHEELVEEELKYGRRQTGGLEDIDAKKARQQYKKENQVHLNKLIQVATIQIDESGLDGATGHKSAQAKQSKSDDEEREEYEKSDRTQLLANHAFAFIVKHNPTNQLLLMGRVVDATQKAESDSQSETE